MPIMRLSQVKVGDSLPGLDNGYVVDVETDPHLAYGTYGVSLGSNLIMLTFHDADGGENYVIGDPDMKLEVEGGD